MLSNAIDLSKVALVAIALIFLSPFDLDNATSETSREIFYRAWSVSYPTERSPKIAVVVAREEDLSGKSWPAPYNFHALALDRILDSNPQAVFVDLTFVDNRQNDPIASMLMVLNKYHNKGIPVFFSTAAADPRSPRGLRDDLQKLADEKIILLADSTLGARRGNMHTYKTASSDLPKYKSPALSLYTHLCTPLNQTCKIPSQNEFEIWWAAKPQDQCKPSNGSECKRVSANGILRFLRLAINGIMGNLSVGGFLTEADPISSPYHPAVSWTSLERNSLEAKTTLQGSVVFYGSDLAIVPDKLPNPVYGADESRELPGVYHHAMAFDNLWALEGNTIRAPLSAYDGRVKTIVIIFVCCAAALLARVTFNALPQQRRTMQLDFVVWSIVAVAISIVEFTYLRTSPANWLGAIAAAQIGSVGLFLANDVVSSRVVEQS